MAAVGRGYLRGTAPHSWPSLNIHLCHWPLSESTGARGSRPGTVDRNADDDRRFIRVADVCGAFRLRGEFAFYACQGVVTIERNFRKSTR